MRKLWNIIRYEIEGLALDRVLLFLALVWPFLYGIMLSTIYSQKVVTKIPIAVFDADHSKLSRTVIRYLDASRSLSVVAELSSRAAIEEKLMQNEIAMGVVIPAGMERDIKRGRPAVINAFINGSNLLLSNMVTAEFKTVVGTITAGIKIKFLRKTGNTLEKSVVLHSPISLDMMRSFNPGFNYMNYLTPGLWASALHQILLLLAALLFVRDFETGKIRRLAALAEGRSACMLIGKIIPYCLLGVLLFEIYVRIFFPIFGIDVRGTVSLLAIFSFVFVLSVVALGTMISVFSKSTIDAIKVVLLIASPAFIMSGYTWPLREMPVWIQCLAHCIPLTAFVSGLRKIYQEDVGIISLWREVATLLFIAITTLALAGWKLKRKVREYVA